jgi:hypothetical protein
MVYTYLPELLPRYSQAVPWVVDYLAQRANTHEKGLGFLTYQPPPQPCLLNHVEIRTEAAPTCGLIQQPRLVRMLPLHSEKENHSVWYVFSGPFLQKHCEPSSKQSAIPEAQLQQACRGTAMLTVAVPT